MGNLAIAPFIFFDSFEGPPMRSDKKTVVKGRRLPRPKAVLPNSAAALSCLLEARGAADNLAADPWQFAVSFAALREAGATATAVRWLVGIGFLEQRREVTKKRSRRRIFEKAANL